MASIDRERPSSATGHAAAIAGDAELPLPWLAQFETGVPLLDSDHRAMVALINRAALEAAAGSRESLALTLDELRRVSFEHFLRETAVLRSFIACSDKPTAAPAMRLRRLDGVIAEVAALPPGKVSAKRLVGVQDRLIDWFLQQIVGQDSYLSAYFEPR